MKTLMQKVGQKVKAIRLSQNLKVEEVYEKGMRHVGKNFISPATMYRIESGEIAKLSSLEQYLWVLESEIQDVIEDTELDEILILTKTERLGGYYGDKFFASIVNNPTHQFLAQEVILEPSGKTSTDYASKEKGPSHKLIYIVQGELNCILGEQAHILKRRSVLSFDSTIPHYFINQTAHECIFLMVESPGRL